MPLEPNNHLREVAAQYTRLYGHLHDLGELVEGHYVDVDKPRAWRIAAEYERLDVDASSQPLVRKCYELLVEELYDQWDHIIFHGYTLEPWRKVGQPYKDSAEMRADVRENKHLFYFTGGEPHPFLDKGGYIPGVIGNEMLRAVHDIFGHATEGYGFGARGEENAWIHHSMMFSPLAQRALTVETRGQNSWVNSGPHSYLPVVDRPYADQKVDLLPAWCSDWRAALGS